MLIVGKKATTTLLGDVGVMAPYFPSHLTYPSIKRYTHGNCKGMKGRHPAYSKLCGSCSYYFFSVSIGITDGNQLKGKHPPSPQKKSKQDFEI